MRGQVQSGSHSSSGVWLLHTCSRQCLSRFTPPALTPFNVTAHPDTLSRAHNRMHVSEYMQSFMATQPLIGPRRLSSSTGSAARCGGTRTQPRRPPRLDALPARPLCTARCWLRRSWRHRASTAFTRETSGRVGVLRWNMSETPATVAAAGAWQRQPRSTEPQSNTHTHTQGSAVCRGERGGPHWDQGGYSRSQPTCPRAASRDTPRRGTAWLQASSAAPPRTWSTQSRGGTAAAAPRRSHASPPGRR